MSLYVVYGILPNSSLSSKILDISDNDLENNVNKLISLKPKIRSLNYVVVCEDSNDDEIRLILILIFVLMHYIVKQVSQILENKTSGLELSEF